MSQHVLRWLVAVALLVAALPAAGCAGVRGATRAAFNTDMVGRRAPAFVSQEWVMPLFEEDAGAPQLDGAYVLVKFFDPG